MCQEQHSGYLKHVDKKTFIMKALLDRLEDGKQLRMPADVKENVREGISVLDGHTFQLM